MEALEDVVSLAMTRGMAVRVDEALDFLEPGYDPFLARRPGGQLLRLDSTPSSASSASSSSVNLLSIGGLRLHPGQESHPFRHAPLPGIG